MINLLPAEAVQALNATYRSRRLVVGGFLFSALLVMALILLGVLYVTVSSRIKQVGDSLAQTKVAATVPGGLKEADLQLFGAEVSALLATASSTSFTATVQNLLTQKTAGIALTDMTYTGGGEAGLLRVSGIAQTREKLLAFLDVLRGNKLFKTVDSPVSNLIKERDVPFVINLEIND